MALLFVGGGRMDATRIRTLVDAALEAQRVFAAAEANVEAANEARARARERHIKEAGNLKSALNDSFVIYGDKVVRVGNNADGLCVVAYPLLSIPVVAPPPAPLPETPPAPAPVKPPTKQPPVLSGGSVPPSLGKK